MAGALAAMLAVSLVVAAVATGTGLPKAVTELSDVGAWLADSALGSVTHAEGPSGLADAMVNLHGTRGDRLRIVQSGSTVLVQDTRTGEVYRIDPGQLTVTQSASYGQSGVQVVASGVMAYVIAPAAGLVQRIDPQTLSVIGVPLRMGTRVGGAAIDGRGTLWLALPDRGAVMPVRDGVGGVAIAVAKPGDLIGLTVAAGKPVVTDSTAATMTIIGPAGTSRTVVLPASVKQTAPPVPLVPGTTPGSTVPLVVPSVNQLVVVDTVAGRPMAVTLGVGVGDTLDPPQPFGQRVYIPDETTGSLIVYDMASGRLLPPIMVTGHVGPLDVFVNDGMLWANDPNGPAAVAVNPAGGVLDIGKYRPRLPGGHPKPSTAGPQSAQAPVIGTGPGSPLPASTRPAPSSPARSSAPSPTPSPSGSPSPSPSPSPTATPQPPGAPTASSGDGTITVTFTPSSGATPLGYTLIGAPSGATVTPASVPAGGPFSFTVSGLDCTQTYAFAVAANYSGAGGSLQSPMTAAMRPCVAPSAPQSLSVTATANHSMTLGWSAPASPGGGAVSYTVSWSGPASGSAANLAGTSYQITGLQNSQTYSYSVTAVSPAGSSQPATGSQALTPPQQAFNFHNNNSCTSLVNVRASPTQASQSLAQVPGCTPVGGTGVAVTVYCQVTGSTATDNLDPSLSGDIWDQVTWNGINGWVNDIYIDTPQSNASNFNAYSDPPLWQCS